MTSHLVTMHKVAPSAVYSAPREMLDLTSLVSSLDTPLTKRPRRSTEDDPMAAPAPDIEVLPEVNPRVCFRIAFLNPSEKKALNVPVGAGGSVSSHGIAITVHSEPPAASLNTGDSIVVEQTASSSQDLSGHFILGGFTDSTGDRVETEVRLFALVQNKCTGG